MNVRLALLCPIALFTLTGCLNFSGIENARSTFACKAAPGVHCDSISGVYANSVGTNRPLAYPEGGDKGEQTKPAEAPTPMAPNTDGIRSMSPRDVETASTVMPLRLSPLVLRVWIAPWTDMDGDLRDQSYLYTVVHNGKWLIEHNQQRIRDQYRPVYPLHRGEQTDSNADSQGQRSAQPLVRSIPEGVVQQGPRGE